MAATSAMSVNPRWTKQGAHWVKSYPSSSSIRTTSQRSSMDAKVTPLDTDVLLNILKVLQKLDCKLEYQGKRLEVLETCPVSNAGSTLVNSPISRKQSTRTAGSKRTLITSEEDEGMNEYARSILKMDYAIDEAVSFVNGDQDVPEHRSVADISVEGSGMMHTVTGTWADLVDEPPEVDLYSVSMYTGDLLGSRMSLDILRQTQAIFTPPDQSLPSHPRSQRSNEDLDDSHSMDIEAWSRTSNGYNDTGIQTGDAEADSCAESVAINTNETKTSPTYLRIELLFHAIDTWKLGVVSKIKMESKAIWKDEKRRFNDLRHTYRAKDVCQQIFDKLGSAMEKEWKREKDRVKTLQPQKKPGVKILRWRIVVSFGSLFNVSREPSTRDVVC